MRRIAVVMGFVVIAGCTHSTSNDPESPPDTITADQIAESHASTAYDAIVKLRANFLSNRGKTTILGSASALPVVYVDGMLFGGLNELRNIPAFQVNTIRLYRAWEAGKFGSDKTGGVIEIVTKQ